MASFARRIARVNSVSGVAVGNAASRSMLAVLRTEAREGLPSIVGNRPEDPS